MEVVVWINQMQSFVLVNAVNVALTLLYDYLIIFCGLSKKNLDKCYSQRPIK
jgi:hypothetical protein